MRRFLLVLVVAIPLTVVAWATLASVAATGIMEVERTQFAPVSEAELLSLDKPALAKLASNALDRYERSAIAWNTAGAIHAKVLWWLSGTVVVLAITLVAALRRPG